jgi:hypothetical protein
MEESRRLVQGGGKDGIVIRVMKTCVAAREMMGRDEMKSIKFTNSWFS